MATSTKLSTCNAMPEGRTRGSITADILDACPSQEPHVGSEEESAGDVPMWALLGAYSNTASYPTEAEAGPLFIEGNSACDMPYNLRKIKDVRESRVASSIVDEDRTSDYDPESSSNPQEYRAPKKHRPWRFGLRPTERSLQRPRGEGNTYQKGRFIGLEKRIALKVGQIGERCWATLEGQRVSQILASWPDHWPTCEPTEPASNFTLLSIDTLKEDRLRRRDARAQTGLDDGLWADAEEALRNVGLGHPAARGCKSCYALGLECDLIRGGRYPCTYCADDGNSCELILEPKRKSACESCTRRRVVCSFRTTEAHQGPCQACVKTGIHCVAGPHGGYMRRYLRLDDVKPVKRAPKKTLPILRRQGLKCAHCRERHVYCSFRHNSKAQECARCRKEGLYCSPPHGTKAFLKTEQSPSAETEDSFSKQRYSRYAAPIKFDMGGIVTCSWCKDISHGILGPRSAARAGTEYAMCTPCTLNRLIIIRCHEHDLAQLPRAKVYTEEQVAYFLHHNLASLAPWEWCAVCSSPAVYQCCRGCGLCVCEDCAIPLMADFDGDLTLFIHVSERGAGAENRVRADASFLRNDGPLMQAMLQADDDCGNKHPTQYRSR